MVHWLQEVFGNGGFTARWWCGPAWQQQPYWGWLHITADVAICTAFLAIAIVSLRALRRRDVWPFGNLLWLFGAFVIAGGLLHLVDAALFWWPAYRLAAFFKLITAGIAWATVLCVARVAPLALSFRSPRELEQEVNDRTGQLQQITDRLQEEVIERRRMAANWHASEEQLQLALQAGGMGTFDWDLTTDRVRYNATQMELTGLTASDGEIDIDAFFELVVPEDRAGVTEAIEAAIRLHQGYDDEFRIRLPNGDIRWLSGRGQVIRNDAGTPIRMMGVNFDITRRKHDEEMLRQKTRAIEFATNGIVIVDALQPDDPILFVNPAFEELTGYSAEEAVGRNCRFLQGPETDLETAAEIRQTLRERRECAVTILNYRKDGTPFWNDLRIAPIFDEQNRVTHYVGIQSDITERIDAEYELFQAREAAVAANRAKTRFLASMSHEIRTPLTAVLGCADILCRRIEAGADRELALVIRNQGESLLQLLNDLLDLSKIEAGKLELRIEQSEVRPLVAEVCKLVEPLAGEKGIALSSHIDETVPAKVAFDPLRVRQILLNLLSNSVKFTDSGQVELHMHCDAREDLPRLCIRISDTGVGIPADRLADVFKEFSQLEDKRTDRGPGTGLGLAIVNKLVQLHAGRVAVESTEGQGTTFRITLPIRDLPATAATTATSSPDRSPVAAGPSLSCRLLIAEDTRSLQFMLRKMLEDQVSGITIVSNGSEAVEAVRRSQSDGPAIDLVLMDMQMPVLNGYEATQRLRASGFRGAIIALTAGAMEGERERCLAAGCTDYLPKPLDRDQLLRTLRRYVDAAATA